MPRIALLLCLLLVNPTGVQAECECLWAGPFSKVQVDTDLVVSATVSTMKGNSIDLDIDRVLRGKVYTESIRVWLDTGDTCRAEPGTFEMNSQWVMALQRIDELIPGGFDPRTPNFSYGRVGDYSLSRCGGYWLSQSENLVSGNLVGGARWDMAPKMSPILIDLVEGFVNGTIDEATLKEAGKNNPALQQLILDTRIHLRQQRALQDATPDS